MLANPVSDGRLLVLEGELEQRVAQRGLAQIRRCEPKSIKGPRRLGWRQILRFLNKSHTERCETDCIKEDIPFGPNFKTERPLELALEKQDSKRTSS